MSRHIWQLYKFITKPTSCHTTLSPLRDRTRNPRQMPQDKGTRGHSNEIQNLATGSARNGN